MKYLKKIFENSSDICLYQSDIDDIVDVFQDLIDEYSLEKCGGYDDQGMSYEIVFFEHLDTKKFTTKLTDKTYQTELRIYSPTKGERFLPFDDIDKLLKDVNNFMTRIKSMGYSVDRDFWYTDNNVYGIPAPNHIYSIGIKIISNGFDLLLQHQRLTGQMNYIKEYNSHSNSFQLSDFEDIMDIFQDIVDEYNLEKGQAFEDDIPSSYDIQSLYDDKEKKGNFIADNADRIISTLIQKIEQNKFIIIIYSPMKNNKIIKFDNEESITNDVDKFMERLQIMGYSVKKDYRYDEGFEGQVLVEFIDTIKIEISLK